MSSFNKKVTFQISAEDNATSKIKSIEKSFSNLSKSYGSVASSVSSFSSKFNTELGILSTVAGTATKGILALGTSLGVATGFAIKSASSYEQNAIAFETMLQSGERAKELLKEISDFAKKTPFQLPELVEGSKQLLAYGFAQEEIIPTMKKLGDLSAGLNLNLTDMTWLYGTTRVQGRLFAKDLYQFTNRGIPLTAELAKQFGVTESEISKMVEEGKVGFPEVEKALTAMTGEGGKFYDLMIKQSSTLGGLTSNLMDYMGQFAREVIGMSDKGEIREGSIFAYLKKGASGLFTYLEQNKDTITKTVTVMVEKATEKIKEWYESVGGKEGIKQKLTELWDTLTNKVLPTLSDFIGIVMDVVGWLTKNWDWLWKVVVAFEAIKLTLWAGGVISAVSGFATALGAGGLVGAMSSVVGFIFSPIGLIAAFTAVAAVISIKAIKEFNNLQNELAENKRWLDNNAKSLEEMQKKVGSLSTEKANEQLQNAINKSKEADEELKKLTERYDGLGGVVMAVADQFKDWAKVVKDSVKKAWDAWNDRPDGDDKKGSGGKGWSTGGVVYASKGWFEPKGTDTIPAMLTPGEMVLNRGQQTNLFSLLNGGGQNQGKNQTFNFTFNGDISDKNQLISEIKNVINREMELSKYGIA